MENEKPYPTDEYGRADGRNYHYRVPMDDYRAMRKVRVAEKVVGRWIVRNPTDSPIGFVTFKTKDNKGPINGLGEYQYSEQWESPFSKSRYSGLEVRYANGGGTKVKGTVVSYDEHGMRDDLVVNATIDMTLGDVKAAANHECDELYETFVSEMEWIEREAPHKSDIRKRECEHKHVFEYSESEAKRVYGAFNYYCEDCGKQFETQPEN